MAGAESILARAIWIERSCVPPAKSTVTSVLAASNPTPAAKAGSHLLLLRRG